MNTHAASIGRIVAPQGVQNLNTLNHRRDRSHSDDRGHRLRGSGSARSAPGFQPFCPVTLNPGAPPPYQGTFRLLYCLQ